MRQPVTKPDQVIRNVRRFADELAANPNLKANLGHVHAWYALRLEDGSWTFGPSKFVGYPDNTAEEYLNTYRDDADGRKTEQALARWFSPVDPASRLGRELMEALTAFLAQWGRAPRNGARISVVSESPEIDAVPVSRPDETLLARIASDPEICGGRPCIRGTRVRVADIIDMMANGAASDEILEDYPYLSTEDIHAALAYAARIADHRVIHAA